MSLVLEQQAYFYSRWCNPTCDAAAEVLNSLEGGAGTLLFSSGMAAISTALMAELQTGDHVVGNRHQSLHPGGRKYLVIGGSADSTKPGPSVQNTVIWTIKFVCWSLLWKRFWLLAVDRGYSRLHPRWCTAVWSICWGIICPSLVLRWLGWMDLMSSNTRMLSKQTPRFVTCQGRTISAVHSKYDENYYGKK